MNYYDDHLPGDPHTHNCVHDYDEDPAPVNKIELAASYGHAFRDSLEGHVTPSMPNWNMDSELDLLTFGERVSRAWDMERLGMGALFDLSYKDYLERTET